MNIKSIWDNEGETLDRYTIVLDCYYNRQETMYECLCLSSNPTHPLGFSQFAGCMEGEHLGKKITFEELPKDIQEHVLQRI